MTTTPANDPISILKTLKPHEFQVLRDTGNFMIPPGNSTLDVSPTLNIADLVDADEISVVQ